MGNWSIISEHIVYNIEGFLFVFSLAQYSSIWNILREFLAQHNVHDAGTWRFQRVVPALICSQAVPHTLKSARMNRITSSCYIGMEQFVYKWLQMSLRSPAWCISPIPAFISAIQFADFMRLLNDNQLDQFAGSDGNCFLFVMNQIIIINNMVRADACQSSGRPQ